MQYTVCVSIRLERGIADRMSELLAAVPVVVLEGPRASGKTALGTILRNRGLMPHIVDLSDPTVRAAAQSAPATFIDNLPTPAFIDEAQLVPELPLAVKRRVDRERTNGAFILTGSSRLGRAQLGGSDPLAGRAARVRLWPMTQGELSGRPCNLVEQLHAGPPRPARPNASISRADLLERVRRGGLPNLAGVIAPISEAVRSQLMREYAEGVLLHEIGQRHDRAEMLRLLQYLAATTSRVLNVSTVANELGSRRATVESRLASLDAAFLVHMLAAHRTSEHRTLTAHPKVHAVDVGLAAWAARVDDAPPAAIWGALVETFVINELLAQAGWLADDIAVRHWRDTTRKVEVDAVLVWPNDDSLPIEVKAASEVRPDDLKGLLAYLEATPAARYGIVFYTGALTLQLADNIYAVPITALWNDQAI